MPPNSGWQKVVEASQQAIATVVSQASSIDTKIKPHDVKISINDFKTQASPDLSDPAFWSGWLDVILKILAALGVVTALVAAWVRFPQISKQNPADMNQTDIDHKVDEVRKAFEGQQAIVAHIEQQFLKHFGKHEQYENSKAWEATAKDEHNKPPKEAEDRARQAAKRRGNQSSPSAGPVPTSHATKHTGIRGAIEQEAVKLRIKRPYQEPAVGSGEWATDGGTSQTSSLLHGGPHQGGHHDEESILDHIRGRDKRKMTGNELSDRQPEASGNAEREGHHHLL